MEPSHRRQLGSFCRIHELACDCSYVETLYETNETDLTSFSLNATLECKWKRFFGALGGKSSRPPPCFEWALSYAATGKKGFLESLIVAKISVCRPVFCQIHLL